MKVGFTFRIFTVFLYFIVATESSTYLAAVYEHAVILPSERELPVNRSTALENMIKNVEIYTKQAVIAGQQDVDILVFPEDGIYGMEFSRQALEPYLEFIPDPKEKWNACDFPEKYPNTEIQRELSCMAKDASLYLVVNFGDRQPCVPEYDTHCPKDGHYQFNTNVIYNPKGELIAKYYKINLYYERQFDTPPIRKVVTFDTPFGKFAVFTCFDILFKNPAIDSLMVSGVGNIVFPTAWMDSLPLLAAIQYHSGFAAGAKVNLLAANINRPLFRFHGSGIYSPNGYAAFQYSESHEGKLLIADLPIIKSNAFSTTYENHNFEPEDYYSPGQFTSYVFHDVFTFVSIGNNRGNVKVCNGALCCFLQYERSDNSSEYFAFGAFDGLHTNDMIHKYYIQVCTLLKCNTSANNSCGEPVKESMTHFTNVNILGTFGTPYISPEILLSENGVLKLSSGDDWSYSKGVLESPNGFKHPVISVGMYARDYDRDAAGSLHSWFGVTIWVAICCMFL